MPNTIPAAAEGLPKINRRKALTVTGTSLIAALTGVAASTLPADAMPVSATPIMAHFRKWKAAFDSMNEPGLDDDECGRRVDLTNRLEREMVAMPVQHPADFAAKFLAGSNYGLYDILENHRDRMLADACRLVGEA